MLQEKRGFTSRSMNIGSHIQRMSKVYKGEADQAPNNNLFEIKDARFESWKER